MRASVPVGHTANVKAVKEELEEWRVQWSEYGASHP